MDNFFVDKTTYTPADTLLAFGLAALLTKLVSPGRAPDLTIIDVGDSYRLECASLLPVGQLSRVKPFPLFSGLNTAKKTANVPQPVDYLTHQRNNQTYFEALKKGMKGEELKEQNIHPPHPDWSSWAIINQMSAIGAYNGLAELWYAHRDCFSDLIGVILDLYRTRPNTINEAETRWKSLAKEQGIQSNSQVAQLQVVNPGMGKGGNRSKATGLSIGGLKGFWIPEYLKYAGLFKAALPRVVSGSKDRKTYVLRPKNLTWKTHQQTFSKFQQAVYASTAAKMDILATLGYCKIYLTQWLEGQKTGLGWLSEGKPGDHIAALDVIFYKYLGSAHATMNLSSMVLPDWLPDESLTSIEQADRFLAVVEEHENVIRYLDEKIGDQEAMLRAYRDFLSTRELRAFYRFNRKFAQYIMSKLVAGGQYTPRQFTTPNLKELIMAHQQSFRPILENEGFLRIASAIRSSTVLPQYFKAIGQPGPYEIHYGLGRKLLRDASYPEKFIQALSKFIQAYMRENSQINERFKGNPPVRRSLIQTRDIDAIVDLIAEFGSETVANLLVAYGYARDPKTPVTNE